MTINEIQDEIIEEFSSFDEWLDRYQLLVDYSKELTPFKEEDRTAQNLIDGVVYGGIARWEGDFPW